MARMTMRMTMINEMLKTRVITLMGSLLPVHHLFTPSGRYINPMKSREQLLWTRYSMHHQPGGASLVHVTGSTSSG